MGITGFVKYDLLICLTSIGWAEHFQLSSLTVIVPALVTVLSIEVDDDAASIVAPRSIDRS